MYNFQNIRQVTSPTSTNVNSPNFTSESRQSVVVNRNTGFGMEPTKLDFKTNKIQSKFTNISMIQSQVVNNTGNAFYTSARESGVGDKFATLKKSSIDSGSTIDPMKQSTINYMKAIYRGLSNLSQQRLRQISQNFLRLYGTDKQITENGLRNIQRQAHLNQQFQQSNQTVQELHKVLDFNRDKRITEEDIMSCARRYLSFQRKQIVYTPMVEERLAVARRLFKQFDVQRKGYLTEKQVPNLLNQTYKCLGKTFTATNEDVKSWMKLTDGDGDGCVTLPQYEHSIIRALKKQGVRIYDE